MNDKRESISGAASIKLTTTGKWSRKRLRDNDDNPEWKPYSIKAKKHKHLHHKHTSSSTSADQGTVVSLAAVSSSHLSPQTPANEAKLGTAKSSIAQTCVRPLTDITDNLPQPDLDESNTVQTNIRAKEQRAHDSPIDEPGVVEEPETETVLYVNNLFSPVNKLHAIPMSAEELRRRTEYPEYFGRRELVSYLRHSKTTGNEIIAKYNLKPEASLPPRLNVLSRLCESEAKTLANGIHKMNNEYFPTSYVADTMKEHMDNEKTSEGLERVVKSEAGNGDETKETVSSTIDLLQNLKHLLKDPKGGLAKDLGIFEKVTHTFGCQNIVNHISFIENCLEELKKKL